MQSLEEVAAIDAGFPQCRIRESRDTRAPLYRYYGQGEMEQDRNGGRGHKREVKQIRTFDAVTTVREGDIVFSLISGQAAVVGAVHSGYLFTQNVVRLTPSDGVDPGYLVYLLNEDKDIRGQLRRNLQGSMVLKYTIRQLRKLIVPSLPDIGRQRQIGRLYGDFLRLEYLKKRVAEAERFLAIENIRGATGRLGGRVQGSAQKESIHA